MDQLKIYEDISSKVKMILISIFDPKIIAFILLSIIVFECV